VTQNESALAGGVADNWTAEKRGEKKETKKKPKGLTHCEPASKIPLQEQKKRKNDKK